MNSKSSESPRTFFLVFHRGDEVIDTLRRFAIDGNDTRIHAHVTLGRSDFSAIGGHLVRGVVYPTLELHLVDYGTVLTRRKDEETRLHLIS